MHLVYYLAVALVSAFLGHFFGAAALSDIKAEVEKVDAKASADALALAAKIKTLL